MDANKSDGHSPAGGAVNVAEKRHQSSDDLSAETKRQKTSVAQTDNDISINVSQSATNDEHPIVDTVRRKKVALLMAYCGQGYYGMQINRQVKTIEGVLLSALVKAGLITAENREVPQSMHFQRAARTDKGVSAARQVVSLRIAFNDGLVEKINAQLPPEIRVLDIKKGTKGFNSKLWCDARSYSYTMPTFAFSPISDVLTTQYRITDDIVDRVNEILKQFIGTHNFHNFTSGKKFQDGSSHRYIMDFKCGKPFLEGELELITLTVKGQSFMLHQIRKMIGCVIAIVRDLANHDVIKRAYGAEKLDLPIAPGVGLVLEEVHYEKYNMRYGSDGLHEALDWQHLNESIDQFRKEFIHPTIVKAETEEKSMFQWLSTLILHTFDVRESGQNCSPNLRSELAQAMRNIDRPPSENDNTADSAKVVDQSKATTISEDEAAGKLQPPDVTHNGAP